MRFKYAKDLQKAIKPGDRYWVCGLRLNPGLTRYVRNLPPTFVEACTWKDPHVEAQWRKDGQATSTVVPVKADGTLDWKRATGASDLHFYDNRLQCVSRYNGLISELSAKMDGRIAEIRARQADMKSREASYDDPDLLAYEASEKKEKNDE